MLREALANLRLKSSPLVAQDTWGLNPAPHPTLSSTHVLFENCDYFGFFLCPSLSTEEAVKKELVHQRLSWPHAGHSHIRGRTRSGVVHTPRRLLLWNTHLQCTHSHTHNDMSHDATPTSAEFSMTERGCLSPERIVLEFLGWMICPAGAGVEGSRLSRGRAGGDPTLGAPPWALRGAILVHDISE